MIPAEFRERMKNIAKNDFEALMSALNEPPVRGIRVNETKISTEDFLRLTDLSLSPIPYAPYGFIPEDSEGIGKRPEHHAGMYYVQDPGAMAALTALDIKPGWHVLDACAAPGGKSSQAASLIGDDGLLFANEFVPKRAKIITANFERLGIKNAVVTSLDTSCFPDMFDSYFDLVLCDAPCSGEGMFRKYGEALTEWSLDNIRLCAGRQSDILDNCAEAVKGGGYLLYSTCTFAPEENEYTVAGFLSRHPDFALVRVNDKLQSVTRDGIRVEGFPTELTRRFYPHLSKGEGQFVALMKRDEKHAKTPTILYNDASEAPSKTEISLVRKFFLDNMRTPPMGRIIKQGGGLAIIPDGLKMPPRSVFMAGVMIGEIRSGNLIPHHQLFSAYGRDFLRTESLSCGDERVGKYLHGEEIPAKEVTASGYLAVLYEGIPLGGGKASSGMIKNHYPKGLRNTT